MERVVRYCYSIHLILSKVPWVGICSHENVLQSTVSWNLSLAGTVVHWVGVRRSGDLPC